MAEPLLLLPGMLCDAAFWRAQQESLADAAGMQVASYGLADSIEAMAEAVLRDAPQRFALAGHSMGGRVSLAIMCRAPERVTRLAILCSDYRAPIDEADYAAEKVRRDMILARAETEGLEAFARGWVKQVIPPARHNDTALVSAVVAMMARHTQAHLAAQTLAGLTRPDFSDLLPKIAAPTLICGGALDLLRPAAVSREMAEQIPGARLVIAEHCAHMIAMENPLLVTAAMRDWLAA